MAIPSELQALEAKLRADIKRLNTIKCENSLAEFTKQAWHIIEPGTPLMWNWHLDTLCAYLEATMDPKIHLTRLIINIPPGSLKSVLVSVMFPAWVWIKNPQKRVLGVSNAQDLSIRDSRRTKQIITDEWYTDQWPLNLKADQSAKTNYENIAGGFRVSLGITANITGKRGDVILMDDPHDASTAQSDLIRQSVLDIYDTKLSTRVNSQQHSVIILIMQRLHAQDLTGHLLLKKKTKWTHVVMPMHYDSAFTYNATKDIGRPDLEDPRKEHELLFPGLFPPDTVEKLEEDMGTYACTPGETPILMADLSTKPIKDVEIGDKIIGYDFTTEESCKNNYRKGNDSVLHLYTPMLNSKNRVVTEVTEVFKYENRPVLEYTLEDGAIIRSTRDHKWYKPKAFMPNMVYTPISCFNVKGPERKARVIANRTVRKLPVLAKINAESGTADYNRIKYYTHRGRQDVYALTTGTGNYVAWGHLSSNSAGQLEQRPSPKGGGILREEWFRVLDNTAELPVCEHIFISCDTAYSEKDMVSNSYSAFTTWGVFWNKAQQRDCILLLDVWFDQVDYPELRRHAHKMDKEKKPDVWLIEKKASGQCHDDKTEVLTNNGWKLFKDVDLNVDLFFTQDYSIRFGSKGYKTHWQKATRIIDEYYSGEMYDISLGANGLRGEMLVTPRHRVIVNHTPEEINRSTPLHKIVTAQELERLCQSTKPSVRDTDPNTNRTLGPQNISLAKYGKSKYYVSKSMYSGRIYCATVPDGTLYTRRITDGVTKPPIWSGNSLVQDLRQSGLMVRTYVPTTDKVSRAYAIQPMLESGQVWIPDRKWARAFAYKMGTFPTGDPVSFDLADTCTQALLYIRNGMYVSHPDDLEHDRPEVRRVSAYGAHVTSIDKDEQPKSLVADEEWRD